MNFSDFKNSAFLLSKEQMKNVKGGGTCGYFVVVHDENGGYSSFAECGISKAEALSVFNEGSAGSRWCCDSCGGTSYCG